MSGTIETTRHGNLAARIAALPDRVRCDPVLLRRGRNLTAVWQLVVGDESYLVRIIEGRVTEAQPVPADRRTGTAVGSCSTPSPSGF